MRFRFLPLLPFFLALGTCAPPPASVPVTATPAVRPTLPYAARGWTDREAAEFLAERLTFGSTPELVERIAADPAAWVESQLNPRPERDLERLLDERYPDLDMDTEKMVREYPAPVLRLLYTIVRANINKVDYSEVTEDAMALNEKLDLLVEDLVNVRKEDRELFEGVPSLQEILDRQDYGDFNALLYRQMAQKFERAVRSENQLREVLTDFWFNHFNVSLTRVNETANFIPGYERDAIRPHLYGRFGDLLLATAKHPAMLSYLDNGSNNPEAGAPTLAPQTDPREQYGDLYESVKDFVDQPGLNENYARELMELHTLGVDGGYTQADIVELARILTGWKVPVTTQPLPGVIRGFISLGLGKHPESVYETTFLFNPEWHDAGPKRFLGRAYPAGRGYGEGREAIAQLADHPATAAFVSRKLARRFTRDEPPAGLVRAMEATFRRTKGDLRAVTATMIEHPEFWNKSFRDAKLKTPFHFVVAAVRQTGASYDDPVELLRWCTRLGQPLYACQPPTGYPDTQPFWTTGSGLLRRMEFAAALSDGRIPGLARPRSGAGDNLTLRLAGPDFQTY